MPEWINRYSERHRRDEGDHIFEHFDEVDRRIARLAETLEQAQRRHFRYFLVRKFRKIRAKIAQKLSINFGSEKTYLRRLPRPRSADAASPLAKRRLFIDVSQTISTPRMTGITRVVTEIARAAAERGGIPVFIKDGVLWGCETASGKIRAVTPQAGDVLLLADQSWMRQAETRRLTNAFKAVGGGVVVLLYDLLPAQHPQFFPASFSPVFRSWLEDIALQCDGVVAISKTVAEDFADFALAEGRDFNCALRLGWNHLGADFDPGKKKPSRQVCRLLASDSLPLFLSVSTVEPRKGYAVALDAMDILWRDGLDIRYVVVGKYGWNCLSIAQRIRSHPEFGRRLIWLEEATDGDLDQLYRRMHALIYPSVAEGFGLPIIESARHGVPVIASDLKVFREIAGDGITYFAPGDAYELARRIREMLIAPKSPQLSPISWRQSANQLIDMIERNGFQYQGLPALKALVGRPLDADFSKVTGVRPPVSIITVTRDSLFYTRLQIEKIRENTSDRDYEIIIVDRGSRDGTLEWLSGQTDVRVIDYPQTRTLGHGHGEAAEMGVRAATYARVVLLDSDAFPVDAAWLEQSADRLDEDSRLVGPDFVAPRPCHNYGFYAHPSFLAFFKADLGGLVVLRKLRGENAETAEESTIRMLDAGKTVVRLPMELYAPLSVGRSDIPTISGGVVHAWYSTRLALREREVECETGGDISAANYALPLQERIRSQFNLPY